jgi:hypothetical protein
MKLSAKDLIEDWKDDNETSSPCCHMSGEEERRFYVSVPITEELVKGLAIGASVKLTVEGKLAEVRTRWSPELEIEVGSIEVQNSKNEFEGLLDDDE